MNALLTPLAVALAGVTAASVGMAVYGVIADPVLAVLFAGAGVMLDVFKYAAWPTAAGLASTGRKTLAGGLVACALVFSGVSGWATFDRLVGAIDGRAAGSDQRLADLELVQQEGRQRVAALDTQLAESRRQAAWMRERGMATKSLDLEQGAIARADTERATAMAKVESASAERTTLLSRRGTTLPTGVVFLLGLGFALALEVVPVLIFLAGRTTVKAPEVVDELWGLRTTGRADLYLQEPTENSQEPTSNSQGPLAPLGDPLLDQLRAAGNNLPKVKDFAKANSIGNTRASAAYRAAEAAGIIKKTASGYVAQETA